MESKTNKFLTMTASPHIKSPIKTKNIMADVIIAMIPMLIWSVYVFGFRALTITAISVASSVLFEYLYRKLLRKSNTISDLSAVVTGMLLAYCIPVSAPLWIPVVGAFFAIIIVKQLYGGIGKNVVNPALAARVFLFIAYPAEVSTYVKTDISKLNPFSISVDVTEQIKAGATPLNNLKEGVMPETSVFSTLLGDIPGCIGEVSATLIILSGIFLLLRKVISWHIPVSFIATVALISFIFPQGQIGNLEFMLYQLFSGGLMIGAFFMATDYVTCPVTKKGKLIYGVGCGLITVLIRYFGAFPEGVSFAILVMNLFVWYLDKATKPKAFGGVK